MCMQLSAAIPFVIHRIHFLACKTSACVCYSSACTPQAMSAIAIQESGSVGLAGDDGCPFGGARRGNRQSKLLPPRAGSGVLLRCAATDGTSQCRLR